MYVKLLFVFLLSFRVLEAVELPKEIQKCKRSDEECMKKSIVNALTLFEDGDKVFGFPPMRPFPIERMEISADPNKSVKLQQNYQNIKLHGITDVELTKFRLTEDGKSCKWEVTAYNPLTRMEADYKITGQVMIFPINGHGKCNITLYGATNKHTADCEHYMKKGKSHMKLKNYKMDMAIKKCQYDFPNIIPENQQISQQLEKTLNENCLLIFEELKGGFEEILAKIHENGANSVFSKIPENELFLPE